MSTGHEPAARGPAGPTPKRPANSVRRTATIDMRWVGKIGSQLRLTGRARDAITVDPADPPVTVAEAETRVGVNAERVIEDIWADPSPGPGLEDLVGHRGGGYLRAAIGSAVPALMDASGKPGPNPTYLLLDDISGTSLIANFAWSRWITDWGTASSFAERRASMVGVCIGFAPGNTAVSVSANGPDRDQAKPVGSIVNVDDPDGWHSFTGPGGDDLSVPAMRRARFIDVSLSDTAVSGRKPTGNGPPRPTIMVSTGFQDSATDPDHGRVAVHEYRISATIDAASMTLTSFNATPHVLPFPECPQAIAKAQTVVGEPVDNLRAVVLERLAKTEGCTHLNDALRALAEVPLLVDHLPGQAVTAP